VEKYSIEGMLAEFKPETSGQPQMCFEDGAPVNANYLQVEAELSIHGGLFEYQHARARCAFAEVNRQRGINDSWYANKARVSLFVAQAYELITDKHIAEVIFEMDFEIADLDRVRYHYRKKAEEQKSCDIDLEARSVTRKRHADYCLNMPVEKPPYIIS
jgi:hypothetical protein